MRVGFIGLGNMGRPMAYNLLRVGHALTVHSLTRSVVEDLVREGARAADSPQEVAEFADVVLACLPNVDASEEVFLGPHGLAPTCRSGQVLADMSTIAPATARKIAQAVEKRGGFFLDAPVSGGVERAEEGSLTIMVGGDPTGFQLALPVFQTLGHNVHHVGKVGAGCVAKLVNQLLVTANLSAVAEAMVLGTKAGANPAVLFDVLRTSWGFSNMLERSVPRFLERDFAGTAAPMLLLMKDMGLIGDLAEEVNVHTPVAKVAQTLLGKAKALHLENQDISALIIPLEQAAGVEVRGP